MESGGNGLGWGERSQPPVNLGLERLCSVGAIVFTAIGFYAGVLLEHSLTWLYVLVMAVGNIACVYVSVRFGKRQPTGREPRKAPSDVVAHTIPRLSLTQPRAPSPCASQLSATEEVELHNVVTSENRIEPLNDGSNNNNNDNDNNHKKPEPLETHL